MHYLDKRLIALQKRAGNYIKDLSPVDKQAVFAAYDAITKLNKGSVFLAVVLDAAGADIGALLELGTTLFVVQSAIHMDGKE